MQIRDRIKSVANTAKVTRAMELVAASKMRRAQDRAVQARPYAESMRAVLAQLAGVAGGGEGGHPLLEVRPADARLGEVDSVRLLLGRVPTGADPEVETATRQLRHGGRHPRQHRRVAVHDVRDEASESDPGRLA